MCWPLQDGYSLNPASLESYYGQWYQVPLTEQGESTEKVVTLPAKIVSQDYKVWYSVWQVMG